MFTACCKRFRGKVTLLLMKHFNKHPLTALAIEINSACNRRCPWCPNCEAIRPKNKFLDETLFYSIIDQLVEMEFRGRVTFSLYNEPLLDRRLPLFIRYTRENLPSSLIYLNTNGDLLDLELWRSLRKDGLDYADVSQYDGKYSRNIQNILEHLDGEEEEHFHAHIFDPSEIRNRAGSVTRASKLPLQRFCDRPFRQLCVTYEGKAVICCNDYFGQVEIGDVRTESIEEVWENETIVQYRKELQKGNRVNLELCRTCDMGHSCSRSPLSMTTNETKQQ